MTERPTDIPPGTRAPGYECAPAYRVAYVQGRVRVTACAEGMQIDTTADVVAVEESGYPAPHLPGSRWRLTWAAWRRPRR